MRKGIALLMTVLALALTAVAGQLTFVTNAVDAHDREYGVYLDLSTKHMEGTYTTMTSYALWDPPISNDGYTGIKWYKNVLQMDCIRHVKRIKYIAYLDVNGKVMVDESYPDAVDEKITSSLVDSKELPYYCGR